MVLVFAYFMRVQLQVVFFEVKCKLGVPTPGPKCMSQPARRLRTCLEAFCGFLVSDNNESDALFFGIFPTVDPPCSSSGL